MQVSLIIPIRNERENIVPLFDEVERALGPTGKSFEVIAVDDGSTDGSVDVLREQVDRRPYLRVIQFRRNYGQSAAFEAGFRHASGEVVVTMDADLQNDPADVPKMLARLEQGFDVICGWRKNRQDGMWLRRIPSRIANWLIRRITGTRVRDLGCSLRVYRREITAELSLYGEMHRFLAILAENIGARLDEVVVNHRARRFGTSSYGFGRTVKVLLDLCTVWFLKRFQTKPIYIFGGAGAPDVFCRGRSVRPGAVAKAPGRSLGSPESTFLHRGDVLLDVHAVHRRGHLGGDDRPHLFRVPGQTIVFDGRAVGLPGRGADSQVAASSRAASRSPGTCARVVNGFERGARARLMERADRALS